MIISLQWSLVRGEIFITTWMQNKNKWGMKRVGKQKIISLWGVDLISYCGSSNASRKKKPEKSIVKTRILDMLCITGSLMDWCELMITRKIPANLKEPCMPHVVHDYEASHYCADDSLYFLIVYTYLYYFWLLYNSKTCFKNIQG